MKKPKDKPTADKEQEKLDKTIKEAEDLKEKPEDEKQEEQPKDEKPEDKPEEKEEKPKDKKVVTPKAPDYKERYIESTKEAQILHSKNKKIMDAFKEAEGTPDPTAKELKAEYSDWDILSDHEKKVAKDSLKNSNRFNALDKVTQEFANIEEWQSKVNEFMGDPETLAGNPLLEGKVSEFKAFASKPTRRGVDFDDLIKAFLYDSSLETKVKAKTNKGKMFPKGSAGDKNIKPKSGKLTVEEGRKLRQTDYTKYKEMLLGNKIEEF